MRSDRLVASSMKKSKPKDRDAIKREIEKKKREISVDEDKILALSDVIKHKTKYLKEKNAHEKAVRVAKARLKTHEEYYTLDLARRPSDRSDDIRVYTKQDLDTWAYADVREWYNKNADPNYDPTWRKTPAETGYMIKKDDDYISTEDRHAMKARAA